MPLDTISMPHSETMQRIVSGSYVLMTAAYNEEENIEKTIESVLLQTLLPTRWVIVSDGSVDRTNEIVRKYEKTHSFMRFLQVERVPGRSFGSKVRALRAGSDLLKGATYDFIGNLDADVSVAPSYFEDLISRLVERPSLGLAAGFVVEEVEGEFRDRSQNRVYSVPHAAQLVRRECYETLGGYAVLEHGGEDWHAQTCAKMKGWEVEAFPELKIFHHRHTGEGDNVFRDRFRQGRLAYSLGSDPLFEIVKSLGRLTEKPFIIGSMTKLAGFGWSWICRDQRPVSKDFIVFLRGEQRARLQRSLGRLSGNRRPKHDS